MYLLSTQALLDVVYKKPSVTNWLKTVGTSDVGLSTISIAEVKASVGAIPSVTKRSDAEVALNKFLGFARRLNAIHPFGEREADIYAAIADTDLPFLFQGQLVQLSDTHRLVVATAITRALILVEAMQPYHANLWNFKVVNP
jgi:predicted nucleic acid-binding protein